jgi:hypothetical protein
VGRASNRKKARRQAAQIPRQNGPGSPPDAATQQAMLQLVNGLKAMTDELRDHKERRSAAQRAWCGGREPVPAEVPPWPEGSLGDRFLNKTHLEEARNAPGLLAADVPDAMVISADPGHWNVATAVLVRAVVFDGLQLDHPAVRMLLEVLAPIAEAELAYGEAEEARLHRGWSESDEDEPRFPELDGPVFLLGVCALVDATWALVGTDPLSEVLAALALALGDAIPDLDGAVVADILVGAFARHYRCEQPADDEALERIGRTIPGNALEHLVATGAVPPGDVLRTGLTILSALAALCMSGSASILGGSPEMGAAWQAVSSRAARPFPAQAAHVAASAPVTGPGAEVRPATTTS